MSKGLSKEVARFAAFAGVSEQDVAEMNKTEKKNFEGAAARMDEKLVEIVKDRSNFFEACRKGDQFAHVVIDAFIDKHPDCLEWKERGLTGLMLGAQKDKPGVVGQLITAASTDAYGRERDATAFLNVPDNEGMTALMHASAKGGDSVILLEKAGAEKNIQDKSGMTALLHAFVNDQASTAGYLVNAGADAHLETKRGNSLVKFAQGTFSLSTSQQLICDKVRMDVLKEPSRLQEVEVAPASPKHMKPSQDPKR